MNAGFYTFRVGCVAVTFSVVLWANSTTVAAGLDGFLGKDLSKLDTNQLSTFAAAFKQITGDEVKMDWRSPRPRWVKKFRAGKISYLLLNVYPGFGIPDVSSIEAHLFDANWNRIAKQSFPTGYRMFLTAADVISPPQVPGDALAIQTQSAGPFIVDGNKKHPAFEQGDSQTQIYGCQSNELSLVRIADDRGDLVLNSYAWRLPMKGPPVPSRSTDTWLRTLASTNAAEVLSTLVWLSGLHLSSTEPRKPDHNQESISDSASFEAVQQSPQGKAAIENLARSSNAWIQAYAKALLRSFSSK